MERKNLADLRRDYSSRELSRSSVSPDPFEQFSVWMTEALDSEVIDPNAMTVSTVNETGQPSSRVVLLKAYDKDGFVFYTNYDSRKATDLSSNPNICMHFFWPDLERQLIIDGTAAKNSRQASDVYFASRPNDSKLGAWASKQSSIVSSRDELEKRFADLADKYDGKDIPCPPFWGGFVVTPTRFEFWQGRASRLHDRICYMRNGGSWRIVRLSS